MAAPIGHLPTDCHEKWLSPINQSEERLRAILIAMTSVQIHFKQLSLMFVPCTVLMNVVLKVWMLQEYTCVVRLGMTFHFMAKPFISLYLNNDNRDWALGDLANQGPSCSIVARSNDGGHQSLNWGKRCKWFLASMCVDTIITQVYRQICHRLGYTLT